MVMAVLVVPREHSCASIPFAQHCIFMEKGHTDTVVRKVIIKIFSSQVYIILPF